MSLFFPHKDGPSLLVGVRVLDLSSHMLYYHLIGMGWGSHVEFVDGCLSPDMTIDRTTQPLSLLLLIVSGWRGGSQPGHLRSTSS